MLRDPYTNTCIRFPRTYREAFGVEHGIALRPSISFREVPVVESKWPRRALFLMAVICVINLIF